MIQLQRNRTAEAIPKTFRGPDRIEKLLLLLRRLCRRTISVPLSPALRPIL
jgi:hypothetical protein